jgi:hypothetical protein
MCCKQSIIVLAGNPPPSNYYHVQVFVPSRNIMIIIICCGPVFFGSPAKGPGNPRIKGYLKPHYYAVFCFIIILDYVSEQASCRRRMVTTQLQVVKV